MHDTLSIDIDKGALGQRMQLARGGTTRMKYTVANFKHKKGLGVGLVGKNSLC